MTMSDREWVRGEIRAALQEVIRAAEMQVTHQTTIQEDISAKAVGDAASDALKEREAAWAATERDEASRKENLFSLTVEVNVATWGELVGDDPTRAAVVRFVRELTKDALVIRAIT